MSFKVFAVVWMRYKFFVDLMTDEDETTMLSQNVRNQISSDTALQQDTKIRIFNACVKSVLLYEYETWLVTNEIQRKIQTL